MSFDLKKPFEANSNIFTDKKHSEVFGRPMVTADRIVILYDILRFITEMRKSKLENRLVANYPLTKFFLLYLLRLALEKDDKGKEFINNLSEFL